ncbi:MAG: DUF5320 domain-containing protein [Bacillota bacterium]
MPWGDGTGPAGRGPRTGRAAGYCAGFNVPGYMNFKFGRGGGRGGRRGLATSVRPAVSGYSQSFAYNSGQAQKQELEYLKNVEKEIQKELEAIKDRIKELEKNEE